MIVSCIMPTHNRRRFVPLALSYFLRQDYEPRELIVVDDGDDPVADLIPQDARIRYVRLDRKTTVGAKRNAACRLARGELIVHWDDDDWMADWRLSYQVAQLLDNDADGCGLDRVLFLDARQGQAWQYVYPISGRRPMPPRSGAAWLAGGTLCYRRELWQRNPFPDLDVGEDNHFVWSRETKRLLALPDNSFYVATIHDNNTSPKRTSGIRWQQHPVEPLRKMLGANWDAYTGAQSVSRNSQPVTRNSEPVARYPQPVTRNPEAISSDRRSPITDRRSPITDHQPPITVSLPYFNCRTYLLRAVDSILAQSHTNLTLVVVNDGDRSPPWDLLAHIDDPRLVRYDLGVNRGRYFVDGVILAATPDPYLLIQDADDWSEPERVATLLGALQKRAAVGAVSSCRLWREGSRASRPLLYPGLRRPLSDRFEFRSDHHGLFRTDALRQIGGNYGGYRIGYDTLLVNLLCMLGEVAYVERPLYHRQVRANSLTTSELTGMRSATRKQVHTELAGLYAAAFASYRNHKPVDGAGDNLAAAIRATCQARVTDEERAEIQWHAGRLRDLIPASRQAVHIGAQVDCARVAPAASIIDLQIEAKLRQMVNDPRLPWSSWSVTPAMASSLVEQLCKRRPRRILEAGSGISTALLARYAELTGAQVVTLEHDPPYFRQTAALLERLALRRTIDLQLASLGSVRQNGRASDNFYRPVPEGEFDFVFVDGPPKRVGRQGALFALAGRLSGDCELWLHNGHRQHEKDCVVAWQRAFQFDATLMEAGEGVWVLRNILPVER